MDFFSEKTFFIVSLLAFVVLFLVFFPHFFASIDEHTYVRNAMLLRNGKFGEQNPELACRSALYNNNGYMAGQFIGKSIFLLPFTFFGLDGIMLSGLLIHVVNAILIFLILRSLKIDARLSILYIFFPAMTWESRTIFSELLVLTFFLAGFYSYIRESELWDYLAGLTFGIAMFVRYDAVAGFIAFALPLLISGRKRLLRMVLGFLPIVILIIIFNALAFGGPLQSGHGSAFSLVSIVYNSIIGRGIPNFLLYTALLLLLFPLMLVSPFLTDSIRKYALLFILLSMAYLGLTASFTDFFSFDFSVNAILTARLRYLVPLIGLLLIPYSLFISDILKRFNLNHRNIMVGALIVLIIGTAYGMDLHSKLLHSRFTTYNQIHEVVPPGALIVGSSDDCFYSLNRNLTQLRYLNIVPEYDLGPNSPPVNLESRLDNNTYFIDLQYSSAAAKTGLRQEVTINERKQMQDFIATNTKNLVQIYEVSEPNHLVIYHWVGR